MQYEFKNKSEPLENIEALLMEINGHVKLGYFKVLLRGILNGLGHFIGLFIGIAIIGYLLNVVGVLPAISKEVQSLKDAIEVGKGAANLK